jgi:nucleoid-associated protein YgaU
MKKVVLSIILLLSSLVAIVSASLASDDPQQLLNETVPDQYEVVKGDTLWDISALFLRDS